MKHLFGDVVGGEMHKNEAGVMVDEAIRQMPQMFAGTEVIKYIVMPKPRASVDIQRWRTLFGRYDAMDEECHDQRLHQRGEGK